VASESDRDISIPWLRPVISQTLSDEIVMITPTITVISIFGAEAVTYKL
jgi:hypothetical protein